MLQKGYMSHPCLLAKFIQVHKHVKHWQQRLTTAKDVIKQLSKEIYKVTSGNALVCFDLFITSTKEYNN